MFNKPYRYLAVFVLSLYTYLSTVICKLYYYFKLDIEWYYAFIIIFIVTLLTWEGSRLMQPYFQKRYIQKQQSKIRYLLHFFMVCSVYVTAVTFATVLIFGMVIHQHSFSETIIPLKLNLIYAWLANLLFHLVNTIYFYFEEYKLQMREAEELKQASTMAELQLIKNQINPHFLFNNLNVLSALVAKDTADANNFIQEFSKVYRYILTNGNKELVTVQEELDFINTYIYLLKKRFNEGLSIIINVPTTYLNYYIIPASLQMLIENAIKHNKVGKTMPLLINVKANGHQTLVIQNNLQLRNEVTNSTNIGLNNIDRRYKIISGRHIEIDQSTQHFTVTLPLLHLN